VSDLKEGETFKLRKQIEEAKTELACFKAMKEMEDTALPSRLSVCREEREENRRRREEREEREERRGEERRGEERRGEERRGEERRGEGGER
jgi:hypothetical protein